MAGASAPCVTQTAEKGFCIWHKACTKEDWEYDKLLIILCAWSTVDGPHDRAFDPTRVPPARKVPCTHHVQKNVLGSHCDTILENTEGDTSAFFARLKAIKWGILPDLSPCGPICPAPPPVCPRAGPGRLFRHDVPMFPVDLSPKGGNRWSINEGSALRMQIREIAADVAAFERPSTVDVNLPDGGVLTITEGNNRL